MFFLKYIYIYILLQVVSNVRHPMNNQPGASEAMMYLSTTERQQSIPACPPAPSTSMSEAVRMSSQISSTPSSYKELIGKDMPSKDSIGYKINICLISKYFELFTKGFT